MYKEHSLQMDELSDYIYFQVPGPKFPCVSRGCGVKVLQCLDLTATFVMNNIGASLVYIKGHLHPCPLPSRNAVGTKLFFYHLLSSFHSFTPPPPFLPSLTPHLFMRILLMITFVLQGKSLLWIASFNGHLEVVKTLIEAGANVNQAYKVVMYMYLMSVYFPSLSLPPSFIVLTSVTSSLLLEHFL